jgi:integrase/recombinase XerD
VCWRQVHRRSLNDPAAVRRVQQFAEQTARLTPLTPPPASRVETLTRAYAAGLGDLRGLAPKTIHEHATTAAAFLDSMAYETAPSRLAGVTGSDLETFVRHAGGRLCRASLQHTVARLRSFLRFLAERGAIRPGLDQQIDTPRSYRLEQLPRSLPWATVRALLRSIDQTTPHGLRDYTMLFLITTYGLRASEVVALTLDAIDWRRRLLRVPRQKTGTPLLLPLTDLAGTILVRYLRRGRPSSPRRELFLRAHAPAGELKSSAVAEVFQHWVRRSGLPIPFQGAHCLRHSYAVHLVRRGVSLKTVGDLLGHRTAESTCVYLRLATDDLRKVALRLPRPPASSPPREHHS